MGLLKKLADGHEPSAKASQDSYLEEQYERLFPKIGRDFLYREDFESIINEVLRRISLFVPNFHSFSLSQGINLKNNTEAISRALEYKKNLNQRNLLKRAKYKDLIDLSDD